MRLLPVLLLALAVSACDSSEPEALSLIPASRGDNSASYIANGQRFNVHQANEYDGLSAYSPEFDYSGSGVTDYQIYINHYEAYPSPRDGIIGLLHIVSGSFTGIDGPGSYSLNAANSTGLNYETAECFRLDSGCRWKYRYKADAWTLTIDELTSTGIVARFSAEATTPDGLVATLREGSFKMRFNPDPVLE